jgi:uncharacterized protein
VKTKSLWFLLALLGAVAAHAAEVIPPVPKAYFNDYAHVVSPAAATELNRQLEAFERKTSIQIVIAVFPRMQSDSSIEDYTVRVAQAWGVGQKAKSNGAVLFVFTQDHKMYLQVGYGLEGALPDALAKRIIENEIKPYFRKGDFTGGLQSGITAILQATQGEYKGTGRTVAERTGRTGAEGPGLPFWLIGLIVAFIILALLARLLIYAGGATLYTRGGRTTSYWNWGGGGGGGFSGGGGGFSGGGGGFSGGGGGFGGGGAGGSW